MECKGISSREYVHLMQGFEIVIVSWLYYMHINCKNLNHFYVYGSGKILVPMKTFYKKAEKNILLAKTHLKLFEVNNYSSSLS